MITLKNLFEYKKKTSIQNLIVLLVVQRSSCLFSDRGNGFHFQPPLSLKQVTRRQYCLCQNTGAHIAIFETIFQHFSFYLTCSYPNLSDTKFYVSYSIAFSIGLVITLNQEHLIINAWQIHTGMAIFMHKRNIHSNIVFEWPFHYFYTAIVA